MASLSLKRRAVYWLSLICVSGLIFAACMDRAGDNTATQGVRETVDGLDAFVPVDVGEYVVQAIWKMVHLGQFVLLGICAIAFRTLKCDARRWAFLHCGAVSLGSEILQAFTQLRHPAVFDVAVNLVGATAGFALVYRPAVCAQPAGEIFGRLAGWTHAARAHAHALMSLNR